MGGHDPPTAAKPSPITIYQIQPIGAQIGVALDSEQELIYLIPTNFVFILFGIAIPTSSFNFIQFFFILLLLL